MEAKALAHQHQSCSRTHPGCGFRCLLRIFHVILILPLDSVRLWMDSSNFFHGKPSNSTSLLQPQKPIKRRGCVCVYFWTIFITIAFAPLFFIRGGQSLLLATCVTTMDGVCGHFRSGLQWLLTRIKVIICFQVFCLIKRRRGLIIVRD